MTAWDIDPDGVNGVLTAVEGVAGEFDTQVTTLATDIEAVVAQSSSSVVADALVALAEQTHARTQFVFARVGACAAGAAQATNAYLDGDQEMAATAQDNALAAPDPRAFMPGTSVVGGITR